MRGLCVVMFVSSALMSGPAFAEGTPQQGNKKDPNEVVCERQEEIGSRLSAVRVCKTRAEWAEERRLTRQDIERGQTQRGCNDRC
jgi:hypothetical protein